MAALGCLLSFLFFFCGGGAGELLFFDWFRDVFWVLFLGSCWFRVGFGLGSGSGQFLHLDLQLLKCQKVSDILFLTVLKPSILSYSK